MASGDQRSLNDGSSDHPSNKMSPAAPPKRYHFSLRAMCQNRNRTSSPGDMIPDHRLSVDDAAHDIYFVFRNGVAAFEPYHNEDKNLKMDGTKAWFYCLGTQLVLEPYVHRVYVETPPSDDLPRQLDFNRTSVSMSDQQKQRLIYLRPGDTVFFQDEACYIKVLAMETKDSAATDVTQVDHSAAATAATEIQVKSSAHQSFPTRAVALPEAPIDDEETDDEDDLDAQINTPVDREDVTPATSRPTDGLAVQDTPSRPFSRDSNNEFSTAPDNIQSQHAPEGADTSTPAARAGAQKGKRAKPPSLDAESQFVFEHSKRLTTYGGTPKQKRQVASRNEVPESPEKLDRLSEPLSETGAAFDSTLHPRTSLRQSGTGETQSSPPNKRPLDDDDDDEDDTAMPASTAPPQKKPRGRPSKAAKASTPAPTKTGRLRGRPSNAAKATKAAEQTEDVADHPPSSGKLKMPSRKSEANNEEDDDQDEIAVSTRTRDHLSPDLDPCSGSTPQSSGTPMTGKAPTKVLLSNSKLAEDNKAKAWLSKQGATIVDAIPGKRTNFICVVGSGELVTTAKVLRSLALGKRVVTDQWLEDSMKEGQLLDLDAYIHDDLVETADVNRSKLFGGKTLFVTDAQFKAYGQGFDNIRELATAAGARSVETGTLKKANGMSASGTIILGGDVNDPDAKKLTQDEGRTVYMKTLLSRSIIQGELLVDDEEMKWVPGTSTGKKGRK